MLLEGAAETVRLTALMLALGAAVGLPFGVLHVYGPRILRVAVLDPIVVFFRGIPSLVLMMIIYFGASEIGLDLSGFIASILAIGVRSGIYQSQIVRGAIQSVGSGQMLAARAIGMSKWRAIRFIVIPQALRLALPPWSNEYAGVLKESSLAYALGVTELMRQGRYIVARTFGNSLLVYTVCAAIYFVLVFLGIRLLRKVEQRFSVPGFDAAPQGRAFFGRDLESSR
ncbi:MAG: amino acid ABC transporter permease [Rhodospirillales bacterium]|nr:amino acid ABC transporter permease [Rhodospirillales bacterium]